MTIRSILFAAALLVLFGLTGTTADALNAGALPDHSHVPGGGLVPANQQILALAGVSAATIPLTSPPMAVPAKNPKIDSHLVELTASQLAAAAIGPPELPPDLQAMIKAGLMRIDGAGRIQVYVQSLDDVASAARAVNSAGGLVQRQHAPSGIVQAVVPISKLQSLAASPSVKFVRLPDYGVPQAGSVTTEGDAILKADLARSHHGLDGTGVRIGVISGGDAGLSVSQASGDLPSVNLSCDSVSNSNAEGTAMMEIVHDIAPGAQLWFAGENTGLDFLADVDCLAANTDVVVDDVGFFNVGPYDGTNIVSANTSAQFNAAGNPIRSYVTAVGNEADKHYQEDFVACPSSTLQKFQATGNTLDLGSFGVRCNDPVMVGPGATLIVYLQWNDPWGASCNDYDLALVFHDTATILAASLGPQTCSQNPTELLIWTNPLALTVIADVVINNSQGLAVPRNLEMFAVSPNGPTSLAYDTPGSSVPAESDAGNGVISVGAINAADPGNDTIEYYSSLGPTNDNRTKPDITGIDCVSVTGDGGFSVPFCGTSAAAPHIAGIAALLLQCDSSLKAGEPGDNPAADRAKLRNALLNSAVDLGATGPDNVYGWGRGDARASADASCPATTASPTPSPTPAHSPGPTPTHTPGGGEIWGDLNCSGHVDAADAGTGLRALSGVPHAASAVACSPATDLDCSGQFNAADVLAILRYLVNLAISVPGCTAIGVRP